MAIKCPNCLGDMKYHIETEKLTCSHCDIKMSIEEFENRAKVDTYKQEAPYQEKRFLETKTFQCPECGAEVESLEEEATIFCPYCGKQTFLANTKEYPRPHKIIPFKIGPKQIEKQYKKEVRKVVFLPKEYKSGNVSEELRGVYVPFWSFGKRAASGMTCHFTSTRYEKEYGYRDFYDAYVVTNGRVDATYDASVSFDDKMAAAIAPFNQADAVKFSEGYCAGFYLDKESVSSKRYEEIAEKDLEKSGYVLAGKVYTAAADVLQNHPDTKKLKLKSYPTYNQRIKTEPARTEKVLFPVWFLTKRKGERIWYTIVNGQTGKMTTDVPVDKMKFLISTLLKAALFFFPILFLFGIVFAKTEGLITLAITALMVKSSFSEAYIQAAKVYCKDHNIGNIGQKANMTAFDKTIASIAKVTAVQRSLSISSVMKLLWLLLIPMILLFCVSISNAIGINVIAFGISAIMLTNILGYTNGGKIVKQLQPKSTNTARILTIIAMALTAIGIHIGAANEIIYYLFCLPNIVVIIYNALTIFKGLEYMTSRPVPHFFDRKETEL